MKYKLRLTLQKIRKDDNLIVKEPIESIETDDMLQLVQQFTLIIAKLHREIHEEELEELTRKNVGFDDDIPF